MDQKNCIQVAYAPKILRNMAEICEEMGVGEKTVKKWVAQGAPIAVEGSKNKLRYSSELFLLQFWRTCNSDSSSLTRSQSGIYSS